MYSPKIAEHLIPPIYRLARARGQHMTTLVNEALARYLAEHASSAVPADPAPRDVRAGRIPAEPSDAAGRARWSA